MDVKKKIFINTNPSDENLDSLKPILKELNIKKELEDSFVYVKILKTGGLEVYSFKDSYVFIVSKELNVNNKMAVEYIMMMDEVDQKFNEACYWSGVNDIKKYVAVVSEKITANGVIKEYSAEVIFSNSYVSAILYLSKKGFDDYIYLEDVDEEV